jgi:transposase-like protein
MDPTTIFCPNLACSARGQTGQGNLGIHSRKDKRFLCTECHKTCSATHGTAFYRRRIAAEPVTLVVTVLAHGCPPQAIVVALGFDERTVRRGMARGGGQGPAVQEHLGEPPRDLGQVQADEIRGTQQGGMVWMALAMMVKTRLWLGGEVSAQRDMARLRRLGERVKRCAARRPLLVCTEGLVAYIRAIRETFRAPVHPGQAGQPRRRPWRPVLIAQVVKRYERRRGGETDRRILAGTPARVETLRRRAQGEGVINTADIERLHATCRERLAPLARRSRALARRTLTLHHGMYLIGTVYNFCTRHASLGLATLGADRRRAPQTPAMAAGITDHCWRVQPLWSSHVSPPRWTPPKQRGRPSRALRRLIERWCS